jgi:hypothetical protein
MNEPTKHERIDERLQRWVTEFEDLLTYAPFSTMEALEQCNEILNARKVARIPSVYRHSA